MNKVLLFISSIILLSSCNKGINTLQTTQTDNFASGHKTAITQERQLLSPFSIQEKVVDSAGPEIPKNIGVAIISDEFTPLEQKFLAKESATKTMTVAPVTKVANSSETRIRLRDVLKLRKELKKNASAKPVRGGKVLSLLSLIFSSLAVLFLFIPIFSSLVAIFGLAGLVCGIVALATKSSGKAMAIIGIVLSGALILLFAFIVVALSGGF